MGEPLTLQKIAEERRTPHGQLTKFARESMAEINQMDEAQLKELEQKIAEQERELKVKVAADESVASGELVAEGFIARVKAADIYQEIQTAGEFVKAAKTAGVDLTDFFKKFAHNCEVVASIDKVVAEGAK